MSDATNTWTSTPAFVATTVQSLTPYLSDSAEQKYDLTTPGLLSHGIHSQFTMDVWGNLTNSTVYSQRGQSGLLIIDETQTTTNIYGCTLSPPTTSGCVGGSLNAERQRLGRLSVSTVTTARPAQSAVVRRASFEYDAVTLQLVSEIQGPYPEEPVATKPRVELRTDRMLDSDGNAILEVVCSTSHFANRNACLNLAAFDQRQWEADPTKVQRYRRMRYDDRGRFMLGTLAPFYDPNASNNTTEEFSELIGIDVAPGLLRVPAGLNLVPRRNTFGDPLNHVNVAGVQTTMAYGALGRERFKRGVLGEFSKTTYTWCTDAAITGIPAGAPRANCPVGAVFRVTTDSTGTTGTFNGKSVAPTMWAYFDRLGREVLKTTRIYQQSPSSTSRWSSVATSYDLTGRAKVVTVPYFSKDPTALQSTARAGTPVSGTPKNTTVDYDAIGRPDRTINPETPVNGPSETVFTYDALKVEVTDPRSNPTLRTMNGRDESVSVKEPGGLTVSFGRDAVGDLKSVSRTPTDGDSANTSIQTDLVHDRLGRKTQINDPDKGGWTYKYNALGELVEQIDAKNQVKKLYRDALGRLIKRTETRRTSGGSQVAEPTAVWTWDTSPRPGDISPPLAGVPVLGALHVETLSLGGYERTLNYDDGGRIKQSTTELDGTAYIEWQAYDEVGRGTLHIDPSTDINSTAGTLAEYSNDGYPIRVREAAGGTTGQIYSEVFALSPRGQVKEERFHDAANLSTTRIYDDATGRLLGINSGTAGAIQNWTYTYDKNTNLLSRWNQANGHNIKETMTYDALDRLKTISLTRSDGIATTQSTSVTYDQLGNLMTKTHQVGGGTPVSNTWTYAGFPSGCSRVAGPHAVSQFDAATYCYDENGNQTLAKYSASATRTITYTGYDLAESIVTTGVPSTTSVSFKYAPDRGMFKRVDGATTTPPAGAGCAPANDRIFCDGFDPGSTGGTTGGSTTYYVSNVEVRIAGTTTTTKRYIGSNLVITASSVSGGPPSAPQYAYLFRDALGSIDAIANQLGTIQQRLSFDPWGQRRYADPPGSSTLWGILPASIAASFDTTVTRQGYTGHEQLDGVGLVHMRGRLYDPQLGRFIQADPFVESDKAQGLNRYSYVLNNPLSLTDPSGYLSLRQVVGIAIAVVAAYFGQYYLAQGAYAASFGIAVAGGFASAYVATGSLRAGLWGAFAAGVFWGIGTAFSRSWAYDTGYSCGAEMTQGARVAKIAAHGAAGGTLTELQGGKFGHGFVSAGVTETFSPAVSSIDNVPAQAVAYAAIGGTASKLAGDSFSNGAATAIYQFLFNTVVHSASDIAKANARLAAASAKAGEIAGQGYATANDAQLAAANRWVPDAYITGKEANWYIVQLSDLSFGYTYPNVGLAGQSQVSPVKSTFVLAQSSNGISVSSINSLAHNHLRGDTNFSDYDRQLLDSPRYRKYPLWLWNENGHASMLRSGANIGGISGARTYSGVRIQNMDIPVTW
ncbi:RHS repeat domain-containing protein [Dokdonella sp.]|uniref:RHS repeat domain-containing protein n=1 Tax=Dokdonella sp. TaxID=2291710 RepID=UPI003529CC46